MPPFPGAPGLSAETFGKCLMQLHRILLRVPLLVATAG